MSNIVGITEASGLALHTMDIIAKSDRHLTTSEIAERLQISANHLAKVHQRLVKAKLLKSTRGPSGGFVLAKSANNIHLIEIIEAVEGPFAPGTCLLGREICLRDSCMLGGLARSIKKLVHEFFEQKTLDSLNNKQEDEQE